MKIGALKRVFRIRNGGIEEIGIEFLAIEINKKDAAGGKKGKGI